MTVLWNGGKGMIRNGDGECFGITTGGGAESPRTVLRNDGGGVV